MFSSTLTYSYKVYKKKTICTSYFEININMSFFIIYLRDEIFILSIKSGRVYFVYIIISSQETFNLHSRAYLDSWGSNSN